MLEILSKRDFSGMYSLMEESFPRDEYRPYEEQLALMSLDEYKVFVKKNGNKVSAFAAVWEFCDFMFLEHLAVDASLRNNGVGGAVLQELTERTDKLVLLEVELPREMIAKRRIGFYERNGFFYNDYDYTQPPISEGKNPVPLRIMTYGRHISEEEFISIKSILYRTVYKQKEV